MRAAIGHGGKTDDVPRAINPQSAALIATKRAQVGHALLALDEGVSSGSSDIGNAGGFREIVRDGGAPRTAEGAEILHFSVSKNKCVHRAVANLREADHLTGAINAVRAAGFAAQSPEVSENKIILRTRGDVERDGQGEEEEKAFHILDIAQAYQARCFPPSTKTFENFRADRSIDTSPHPPIIALPGAAGTLRARFDLCLPLRLF